jgi:hypothetical protein
MEPCPSYRAFPAVANLLWRVAVLVEVKLKEYMDQLEDSRTQDAWRKELQYHYGLAMLRSGEEARARKITGRLLESAAFFRAEKGRATFKTIYPAFTANDRKDPYE